MSDIKTALAQAIDEWEQGVDAASTPAQTKAPTTGVSHATFDYIKRNPGKSIQAVVRELEVQGYKTTSTTTLISAMVRQGLVHKDKHKCLRTTAASYSPVQAAKKPKGKVFKDPKPVTLVQQGIAALQPHATPAVVEAAPTIKEFNVDALIDSLTLRQAMELRKRLNDMWMGSHV